MHGEAKGMSGRRRSFLAVLSFCLALVGPAGVLSVPLVAERISPDIWSFFLMFGVGAAPIALVLGVISIFRLGRSRGRLTGWFYAVADSVIAVLYGAAFVFLCSLANY